MDMNLVKKCSTCRKDFVSRYKAKGDLYRCCSICILHRSKCKQEAKVKICKGIWRFCFTGDKLRREYDSFGNEII